MTARPEGPAPTKKASQVTDKSYPQNPAEVNATITTSKTQPKQTHVSRTKVYQRLHGGRTVVSVRVKPELKEAIKRFCRRNGLSICHITEALWTAFLYGVNEKIELVNQSPTIELTLVRDVKRVRRYAVEVDGEGCLYCGRVAVGRFRYLKTREVFPLCSFHANEFVDGRVWGMVKDE